MPNFVVVEFAAGFTLFEVNEQGEIAQSQNNYADFANYEKFKKVVKLKSFAPFKSAGHALENSLDVSEGILNPYLKTFLEMNLQKAKHVELMVGESNLAGCIKEALGIECVSNETTRELIRGIRTHASKLVSQLKEGDIDRAQLGLGHAYSRSKVKFNVNRVDNMIIQSIALLDQLDKDVNTFSMRVREWYGWHFPELIKIVTDSVMYCRLVKFIKNKAELTADKLDELEKITEDSGVAQSILNASRASMGTDISEIDMTNVLSFTDRVISLTDYRKSLYAYLCAKMHAIAPNVSALIGEIVGARLIAHAGSLTNLAKYPASTVQILGAEKALFRALKTKGNTPKYGLIYHSSFIGRAGQKNKGRISRVLANKVSIASRIDCFIDTPTSKFGEVLRDQVEERLKFYEEGITPRTNAEAMSQALKEIGMMDVDMEDEEEEETVEKPQSQKRKAEDLEEESPKKKTVESSKKKDKKDKKKKEVEKESPKKEKKEKKEKKIKEVEEQSPKKEQKEKKEKKEKKKKSKKD